MADQTVFTSGPSQDSSSGANTVLLIVVILLIVGGGFWWYKYGRRAAPATNNPSINVDVNLPKTSGGDATTTP